MFILLYEQIWTIIYQPCIHKNMSMQSVGFMNVWKYLNSSDHAYEKHIMVDKKNCKAKALPASEHTTSTLMAVLFCYLTMLLTSMLYDVICAKTYITPMTGATNPNVCSYIVG